MEFLSELFYLICIHLLLNMYAFVKMFLICWMFELIIEIHLNKDSRILNFNMFTIIKKSKSWSIDIQIRPIGGLYFDQYNSMSLQKRMTFELARLETFKSAPTTLRASGIKLAKAGFYYTGDGHKCKCAFCGFSYDLWDYADDPDDIHRRFRPDCPFLADRCSAGNIPMHVDERYLFQQQTLFQRQSPFLYHSPTFYTSSFGEYQPSPVAAHGRVSSSQTNRRVHDDADNLEIPHSPMGAYAQESTSNTDRHSFVSNSLLDIWPYQLIARNFMSRCRRNRYFTGVTTETDNRSIDQRLQCRVCLTNRIEITIVPCGHFAICELCCLRLRNENNRCPICRGPIQSTVRTYIPE